jgi:hypothetical protein
MKQSRKIEMIFLINKEYAIIIFIGRQLNEGKAASSHK